MENVRIDVSGPHGDLYENYFSICGEMITTWVFGPGEGHEETIEGSRIDRGIYVATAYYAMPSLAYASTTNEVE